MFGEGWSWDMCSVFLLRLAAGGCEASSARRLNSRLNAPLLSFHLHAPANSLKWHTSAPTNWPSTINGVAIDTLLSLAFSYSNHHRISFGGVNVPLSSVFSFISIYGRASCHHETSIYTYIVRSSCHHETSIHVYCALFDVWVVSA